MEIDVREDYAVVGEAFKLCVHQLQEGKGMERHNLPDRNITIQPTFDIIRACPGFARGQMIKKGLECSRLSKEEQLTEMIGAVNYGLFTIVRILEELEEKKNGS